MNVETLRNKVFGIRLWIGLSAVFIAGFFVRPSIEFNLWKGIGVICFSLGLILRAWSAAVAGQHTRAAKIEGSSLATDGPYAYVRNPIYLGSMVLGFGMVCLIGDLLMILPCFATFAFLYFFIIPAEEKYLSDRFGSEYENYKTNVPRLIPRIRRWDGGTPGRPDYRAAVGEWWIAAVCAWILLFLWFVADVRG
jgi:protein-S-isoprenylcysteine O-methyltransferase Ste14